MIVMVIGLEGIYLPKPIYEGATVKGGFNLVVGISSFVGWDTAQYSWKQKEVVDSVVRCGGDNDGWGLNDTTCWWEKIYNEYTVSKSSKWSKKGVKFDIKAGYNLSTLVENLFYLKPFADIQPYIILSGIANWYKRECSTCYKGCQKECNDGCIDSVYSYKSIAYSSFGIGLKMASKVRNEGFLGIDVDIGQYGDYTGKVILSGGFRLLIGFGSPEYLSASVGIVRIVRGVSIGEIIALSPYVPGGTYNFSINLTLHHKSFFVGVSPAFYRYPDQSPRGISLEIGKVF